MIRPASFFAPAEATRSASARRSLHNQDLKRTLKCCACKSPSITTSVSRNARNSRLAARIEDTSIARTRSASRRPLHQIIHGFLKGSGGRLPISSRKPRPTEDLIVTEMDRNVANGTLAVALRVLDLIADIFRGFSEPCGRDGSKFPHGGYLRRRMRDRVGGGVRILENRVACRTHHRFGADAAWTRIYVHPMRSCCSVTRAGPHGNIVRSGVTVCAPGMGRHLIEFVPVLQSLSLAYGARWVVIDDTVRTDLIGRHCKGN